MPSRMADKISGLLTSLGFSSCHLDHSIFVVLMVYFDIIVSNSHLCGVEVQTWLKNNFQTNDMGSLDIFWVYS